MVLPCSFICFCQASADSFSGGNGRHHDMTLCGQFAAYGRSDPTITTGYKSDSFAHSVPPSSLFCVYRSFSPNDRPTGPPHPESHQAAFFVAILPVFPRSRQF